MSNYEDSFEEEMRRERETANIGERLLAQGKSIVYMEPGRPENEIVEEHPDGSKNLIVYVDGERLIKEYYEINSD